jgi:hypothetical protein
MILKNTKMVTVVAPSNRVLETCIMFNRNDGHTKNTLLHCTIKKIDHHDDMITLFLFKINQEYYSDRSTKTEKSICTPIF